MGAGQGFAEGVQMAGSFLMPALQHRMQQKRYDQQNDRFDQQLAQRDKQYYDRLALDQAWKDGFYGGSSPLGGEGHAAQIAQPSPAQSSMSDSGGLQPSQLRQVESPASMLANGYRTPSGGPNGMPVTPARALAFPDPMRPTPMPSSPASGPMQTHAQPQMRTYRGPSPSSTPFSTASSMPHTEQRTFNTPKDPSMIIKKMPEVTHESPNLSRIRPGTPMPPQSMMQTQPFRQSFRRGY